MKPQAGGGQLEDARQPCRPTPRCWRRSLRGAAPTIATWRCACRSPTWRKPRSRLPAATCAGARRIVRRTSRAPTPARCRPRCWPSSAAATRSSATPSAARSTTRATSSWPTRPRRRWRKGVTPIVCVGETLAQREAGETDAVVKRQLSAVIHTLGALRRRDGRGLRAGVGHRHRPHRHARAGAGGARAAARAAARRHRARRRDEDPLRRQRQGRQRRARCSRNPTSTAA